ncbi:hypothetical protein N7486_008105 [Penicillium sp. IBT 16267x]|nr:hypothetical protein N7486_008105 [Penicillium sp. IBT 16267x]
MAQRLYEDGLKLFSATRVWLNNPRGRRFFIRVRVPRQVIEAAPEHGGLGILGPGVYDFDYRIKCTSKPYWRDISDQWHRSLHRYVRELAAASPGVRDLTLPANEWFERDVAGADASAGFTTGWSKARVHQSGDWQTRHAQAPHVGGVIMAGLRAFNNALSHARGDIRSPHLKQDLQEVRGLPGYGVLDHEWFGMGAVVLSQITGARERLLAAEQMANATHAGQMFLGSSRDWPENARLMHLTGPEHCRLLG